MSPDIYTTDGSSAALWKTDGTLALGDGSSVTPPQPPEPIELPPSPSITSITTYVGEHKAPHPSVVDMGQEWNGYRWWLADTPYPSPTGDSDSENPCIWASNDRGMTWEVPDGVTNPLEPWPGGAYNSDTELVWDPEGEQLVVVWRRSTRQELRYATSPDGHAWTVHGTLFVPEDVDGGQGSGTNRVAPTIVRVAAGDWRLWLFAEGYPPRQYAAPSPSGPWTFVGQVTYSQSVTSWHGSVELYKGRLIGVFGDRNGTARPMLATDGTGGMNWQIGDVNQNLFGYRTTMQPSDAASTLDVWSGILTQDGHTYRRVHESTWLTLE